MEIVKFTAALAVGLVAIYAFEKSRQRLTILRAKIDSKVKNKA